MGAVLERADTAPSMNFPDASSAHHIEGYAAKVACAPEVSAPHLTRGERSPPDSTRPQPHIGVMSLAEADEADRQPVPTGPTSSGRRAAELKGRVMLRGMTGQEVARMEYGAVHSLKRNDNACLSKEQA